jgi:NitT/TauT family transport system ATP-binding protein
MMDNFLIEYKGLNKSFPRADGGTNIVLNNINLRIRQGEFVTLVGGSGSGKSTLFNHLLGSLKPSSGQVLLNDRQIDCEGPDRGIVPQGYSLFPFKRVIDNIAMGVELPETTNLQRMFFLPQYFRARKKARLAAMELIPELGLEASDASRWPFELSGGMKQRVAIGTALIKKPLVLMMDEPFSALDPETRTKLQKLILRKWKELGLTIIFVTHAIEEAVYLGTRVVGLSKFWLDSDGKPGNGATIVLDRQITDQYPRPLEIMDTPNFHDNFVQVKRLIETSRRVSRDQFDLSHPDAVKTA